MRKIKEIWAAIVYLGSGKRVITPYAKKFIDERKKSIKKMQEDLDKEHSTGYGKQVIDGKYRQYTPFTKKSIRTKNTF